MHDLYTCRAHLGIIKPKVVPVLLMGGALFGWKGEQKQWTREIASTWFIPNSHEVSNDLFHLLSLIIIRMAWLVLRKSIMIVFNFDHRFPFFLANTQLENCSIWCMRILYMPNECPTTEAAASFLLWCGIRPWLVSYSLETVTISIRTPFSFAHFCVFC